MSENLDQNLNDKVSKQSLERNLNKNTANKNSYKNLEKSEQSHENLDKNPIEASSSAKILSKAASKCKAQNFFKKALELSLQGVADALICAGKAGVWLSNVTNCLKDEAQRAEPSKINEEQAKFEGLHILPEKVKELILERLKVEPEEVEFAPIYLAKKQSFGTFCTEYFYEARAKIRAFYMISRQAQQMAKF